MEYKIYNNCIKEESERIVCEELIKKQADRLERFVSGDSKNLLVNIFLNKASREKYLFSAIIHLKQGTVLVKQSGDFPEAIIHSLFDRLKPALSKRLHKYRNESRRHHRKLRMQSFNESLNELIGLKEDGSEELLKDLLKVLLNDLARYIRRRLRAAEMTTAISRGKIKLQELLDEIYLVIHDRLDEIPNDEIESKVWLFRVADEYLAEKFEELEFENAHFVSLEQFVEKEYQSLEQGFSVDAEFEIVPLEELDEYEDSRNVFSVNDFPFYKEDLDLHDEIALHLDKDAIHDLIDKELVKLPVIKRTIVELFLVEQMTEREIAGIKGVSETEVEAVIREITSSLKKKLSFML